MIGQAERLYQLNSLTDRSKEQNKSKIISVTSGKGGTGKSFVASNLALQLSRQGLNVLLIDLDINLANQNVLFNITKKMTLYHYMIYNKSLEDLFYNYSENLDIILGDSGKIDHPKLTEDKVRRLISDIKSLDAQYDTVIFDTSSGIENGTLELLLNSDEILLVATPEPTSIMDGYVMLKLLKNNGSKLKPNIVINKCFDENDGIEAFNNLETATQHFLKTNINYLGNLSFSHEVIKSIRDQKPLVESIDHSQLTDQFQQISSKFRIPTIG
jgi:flagellar biosynthesis protein FlhG